MRLLDDGAQATGKGDGRSRRRDAVPRAQLGRARGRGCVPLRLCYRVHALGDAALTRPRLPARAPLTELRHARGGTTSHTARETGAFCWATRRGVCIKEREG